MNYTMKELLVRLAEQNPVFDLIDGQERMTIEQGLSRCLSA